MNNYLQGTPIGVRWSIYKGPSNTLEDFSQARLQIFVIGLHDKYAVSHEFEDGIICFAIPEDLPVGTYSLRAVWTKNGGRAALNGMCGNFAMSQYDQAFFITDDEEDPVSSTNIIRIKSAVATYGYDGMGSWELSVFYGKATVEGVVLSEENWIANLAAMNAREEQIRLAELQRVSNENERKTNEDERKANEVARIAAEAARDARYAAAEGTPDDDPDEDGSRWARFNEAQEDRTNLFDQDYEKVKFFADHGVFHSDFLGDVPDLDTAFFGRLSRVEKTVNAIGTGRFYGHYTTSSSLPTAGADGYAYVGTQAPFKIFNAKNGRWSDSGCTVNNVSQADGEDLTAVGGYLKLADRISINGRNHVILRTGSSLASQVTMADTVYEVRYNFTISGTLTMPYNCTLLFNGGTISDGSIVFNNTALAGDVRFSGITPGGSIANYELPVEWFGFQPLTGLSLSNHKITFNSDMDVRTSFKLGGSVTNLVIDGNYFHIRHYTDEFISIDGEAHNVVIRNFNYEGTTTTMFFTSSSGNNVQRTDFEICNNNISTCRLGISCNSDEAGESLRFNVHDNHIEMNNDSMASGCYGIHVANCNYSRFWNNWVSGSNRHAFYHAWGHDNLIYNNTIENNWQQAASIEVAGCMYITRNSHNIRITGNNFRNNKNVMLFIQAGEYDARRSTTGVYNINVTNNTFIEESNYVLPMVMIGFEGYTGEYIDRKEQNINIRNNSFHSSLQSVTFISIHSGYYIDICDNRFSNGSDTVMTSNTKCITFVPNNHSRVNNITICRNTFDIWYRWDAEVFWYYKGNEVRNESIFIKDNVYLRYRLRLTLGYIIYTNMSREMYPNTEGTNKVYYRLGEHLDGSDIDDEYHEVGDIVYLYVTNDKTIDGSKGRPKVGLRCVAAGCPAGELSDNAVWWPFGTMEMANTNYNTSGAMPTGDQDFEFGGNYFFSGLPGFFNGQKWVDANGFDWKLQRRGDWTARPADASDGFCFFDYHLGKPIWSMNGQWYLADGSLAPEPGPTE